jgi:hypothetical protein
MRLVNIRKTFEEYDKSMEEEMARIMKLETDSSKTAEHQSEDDKLFDEIWEEFCRNPVEVIFGDCPVAF